MKRWIAPFVIAGYLGALGWGIVAHTLRVGEASHPAMYFVVWDMFCGWGAYSNRTHLVAEGASGKHYELTPAPWGDMKPFGNINRIHYDSLHFLSPRVIRNTLKHTDHEPIARVFIVEELWPKKFNLPDALWDQMYDEPKDKHTYYNLRAVTCSEGNVIRGYDGWVSQQIVRSVSDNPRVLAAQRTAKPFYSTSVTEAGLLQPPQRTGLGSPVGN